MGSGRFAVIGDLQETSRWEFWREDNSVVRARLIRSIVETRPAFVVLLGDLVFDGSSAAEWSRFDELLAPLRDADVPLVPILGNHDYWWGKRQNLRFLDQRFPGLGGRRWHGARFRGVELLFLDSNPSAFSAGEWREQCRWFQERLCAADDDPSCGASLVFVHHPPFTNSSVTRGSSVVRRAFLGAFLSAKKTRAMLSGHVHSYERFEENGKVFVVAGGGGGPRVRLLAGRRCRHRDRYASGPGKRPCHYLIVEPSEGRIAVDVRGLEREGQSVLTMETFRLELAPSNAGDADP